MFKVFFLIVQPAKAWERTTLARRGYVFILATYLLPFIALDVVVQGWSLLKWGRWHAHFHINRSFSLTTVIHFEILQAVLLLAMVVVSALLIWLAAESFHGRRKFLPVFTTIAYGYSPLFLANLLNVFPEVNPIVSWALGIVMTVWVLYQGIPHGLQPDPTQAFGIYLSTIFVVVLLSGLVHLLGGLYLMGYVDFHNSWVLQQIGNWLGEGTQ